MISGKVEIDNVDEPMDLSQVIIVNNQTEEVAKSDKSGNFQIRVNLNDELIFRSGFTIPRSIKINQSILSKGFLNIHLDLEVIQLAEANIHPLKPNLKDNIDDKMSAKDQLNKDVADIDYEFKQQLMLNQDDTKARRTISEVGGVNLLGIARAFIKPKIKTKSKTKYNFEVIDEIKGYFTSNYFIKDLKIPEDEVNNFIGYCMGKTNLRRLYETNKITEMAIQFEHFAPEYVKLKQTN